MGIQQKVKVNPFLLKTVPNRILDLFARTIGEISRRNGSGSSTLDCWLSPLFGERKSISDQAPIRLDIGLLLFSVFNYTSHMIFLLDILLLVAFTCVISAVDVRMVWLLHNSGLYLFVLKTSKQPRATKIMSWKWLLWQKVKTNKDLAFMLVPSFSLSWHHP